jgi:hypothetical protein
MPRRDQPSCHFTTGVLANILGRAADGEVAVLEVECRSRGDQRCRFLFGGADAVYSVYVGSQPADLAPTAPAGRARTEWVASSLSTTARAGSVSLSAIRQRPSLSR